jgi:hypothetical protein
VKIIINYLKRIGREKGEMRERRGETCEKISKSILGWRMRCGRESRSEGT